MIGQYLDWLSMAYRLWFALSALPEVRETWGYVPSVSFEQWMEMQEAR